MTIGGFFRALWRLGWLGGVVIGGAWRYRSVGNEPSARLAWMQDMSRRFLRLLHCDVRVSGEIPRTGLIVSNHLSYVDILVIGSVCPAVFVAKSEVRNWPVFGWLCRMAGTIFIARGQARSLRSHLAEIARPLAEGFPVVLFPEGTSSDGSRVLPFFSGLLEAARLAEAPITPCAIRYELPDDGCVGRDICYWGDMVFAAHLFRLLSKPHFRAGVSFAPARRLTSDRKSEAIRFQTQVAGLLNNLAP